MATAGVLLEFNVENEHEVNDADYDLSTTICFCIGCRQRRLLYILGPSHFICSVFKVSRVKSSRGQRERKTGRK